MSIVNIFPLISAIFVFVLGVVVFWKNKKSRINLTFFFFCLAITIWMFGTFMMFLNKGNNTVAIFWDRFVYLGVVFIPAVMYHFSLAITHNRTRLGKVILYFGYLSSFIFFFTVFSSNFVNDIFVYQWGVHTKAQLLHHIFLIYFFIYIILFFVWVLRYYKKSTEVLEQRQLQYVFFAFFILAIIGPIAYLPAYGIGIYPFAYVSGLAFVIILAYAILRYHLMDIKVITTQIFSVAIVLVTIVEVFNSASLDEIIIRIVIFLATLIFAILLIRSVLKEVKRREQLEIITKQLAKATNKLQKANKQLKQLDQAKSEFISIASHQLRTPLTAIKGYGSMLLDGDFGEVKEEKQKDAIRKMFISNNRLINLVENLLNISRIESGRLKFEFKEESLTTLAREIYDNLKQNAEGKGLYLKFVEPKTKLPPVKMDSEKIRQIVINFIDNAIKYTKDGGITVNVFKKDNNIVCCVKDTGMGVSKEEQAKLFRKFARGKDAFLVNTEGMGLGLYVAQMMIQAHKGNIWVESDGDEKGSKFCFSIPL